MDLATIVAGAEALGIAVGTSAGLVAFHEFVTMRAYTHANQRRFWRVAQTYPELAGRIERPDYFGDQRAWQKRAYDETERLHSPRHFEFYERLIGIKFPQDVWDVVLDASPQTSSNS